ncbi:MAG: IS200/IS605 family transposase [Acidobacteriia bacterium]|nr:IS200/IS605 family transposase [Terriglobia bacterium]
MSHTYSSNRIHVVFSTKERQKHLREELQPKLWAYIAGIARNHKFEAIKIGGVEDHCHALILLPAAMPLSKAVQTLKGCSSKWLNDTGVAGSNFAWQEGYGAFSVSASQTNGIVEYIKNQLEHHKRRNFEEEFLELLKRYGINYDPAHVLG